MAEYITFPDKNSYISNHTCTYAVIGPLINEINKQLNQ